MECVSEESNVSVCKFYPLSVKCVLKILNLCWVIAKFARFVAVL